MKRILTLCLTLALSLSIVPAAFAFEATRTYTPGQFKDVPATMWCSDNVKLVYENGIMNGMSNDSFGVNGTMTVAQAMVIACRLHAELRDKETGITEGATPWYQPYVEYAKENNLWLPSDGNYNKAVTRGDFVTMLSMATPGRKVMTYISSVDSGAIPDVNGKASYAKHVYLFYRTGILTGNDAKGTFAPDSTITRGAASAIISRVIDESLRTSITLTQINNSPLVALEDLVHYDDFKQSMTDEELEDAYNVALEWVTPLVGLSKQEQIRGVYAKVRFHKGVWVQFEGYDEGESHLDDAYGCIVRCVASPAGINDAVGLCLDMLGLTYETAHTNDSVWHWCRVDMGKDFYWICDVQSYEWGDEALLCQDDLRMKKYIERASGLTE